MKTPPREKYQIHDEIYFAPTTTEANLLDKISRGILEDPRQGQEENHSGILISEDVVTILSSILTKQQIGEAMILDWTNALNRAGIVFPEGEEQPTDALGNRLPDLAWYINTETGEVRHYIKKWGEPKESVVVGRLASQTIFVPAPIYIPGQQEKESDRNKYSCGKCHAVHCKLWRAASSSHVELICAECLRAKGHTVNLEEDVQVYERAIEEICYVPAIPDLDGSWWGFASVPSWWVAWWNGLPDSKYDCTTCRGEGKIKEVKCVNCDGTGEIVRASV